MKLSEYIEKYGDFEINEEKAKELIVEKKGRWKPELLNAYYFVTRKNEIGKNIWRNEVFDKAVYKTGNCFETKEEAEFALEKAIVTQELKDFAKANNEGELDWTNCSKAKFFIAYDYIIKKVDVFGTANGKSNDIYFTSREITEKAIETIGEERLKKYYLGVE